MRKGVALAAAVGAAVVSVALWTAARTQPAPSPASPDRQQGPGAPKGTEIGFAAFQTRCMGCHGNPNVPQAPQPSVIRQMSPERIYAALTTGPMQAQGAGLSDEQKKMLAAFMSGRPLGSTSSGEYGAMQGHCETNPSLGAPSRSVDWDGWSPTVDNTRFQARPGLSAADVPRLKLKWAFGYPDGLSAYGQPTLAAGRVFVGADTGYVYSLNAQTGCVYWSYKAKAAVRGAVTVGRIGAGKAAHYAVFFGDFQANAYGVDAQTGKELWVTKVDPHFVARVTAGLTYYQGRLYVPISSSEGFSASTPDYPCCTSRGSVSALDAATGKVIWKAWTMDTPRPTHKNDKGVQLWGPAGGPVWNAPTVDPVRHAIYFGDGDASTEPAPPTTDSVIAVDMATGKRLWSYQTLSGDAFLGGCEQKKTEACPKHPGPDYDIGNSPILKSLPGGHRALLVGTKDGYVIALDPDAKGKLLWKVQVVPAEARKLIGAHAAGGIYWGGAADASSVYYGLDAGAITAVRIKDGKDLWYTQISKPESRNSAAASVIPGVAFVGGMDGKLHALATGDGHELWSFDTAQSFDTVNKVAAHGGGMGSAGPTISDGMLFVGSGYAVVGDRSGNVLLAFAPE
jgi:polyvinyl alcohol dehydrogenase (cytochrome)